MADELGAIRALANAGLSLAEKTSSGRMGLARVAALADPELMPARMREQARKDIAAWSEHTPDPMKAGDVEKILKSAWGDRPSKVLDEFDPEPVATTVTSQVHKGQRDGTTVAIKVLRPGLAELIRADLKVAETLAAPLKNALPQSDPTRIIRETSERLLDELDLEHEGQAQRALGRALRGVDGVSVPAPDTELTHSTVLVREWAEGRTLAEGATVPDAGAAARDLITALVTGARNGTLHADPEPANIVVAADGTLQLIDAGAVARIPAGRVAQAAKALDAFHAGDADALGAALADLGWLADTAAAAEILAHGRDLAAPFLDGPARLDAQIAAQQVEQALDRIADIAPLAGAISVVPEDLWALRGINSAALTIIKLGATHDWPTLLTDALNAS